MSELNLNEETDDESIPSLGARNERGTRIGTARGKILTLATTAGTGMKADVEFPAPLGVVRGVYISKNRIEADQLVAGSEEDFEAFRMSDGSIDIRVKSSRDPEAVASVFK